MQNTKPNIILILADDMGFSDIDCYGSEIKTPNLNKMANDGISFSQMYNSARCCPSRASLLTGLYPNQAGLGDMVKNLGIKEYQGFLRDDCVTIAEALKTGGYKTYMSGKWHVGGGYVANKPETWRIGESDKPTPSQRGFDKFYGILGGGGSYFDPPYLMEDNKIIKPQNNDYYLTDAITDKAIEMISDPSEDDNPFFMYLSYTAPHWPLHALPEDIAKYQGKYRNKGWDIIRSDRHEELNSLGILNPTWEISPGEQTDQTWENLKNKDWEDLRMAVYAAQIDRMDQGIGRILDTLKKQNMEDNTLIMFLSDNGGCAEFLAEDSNTPEPYRYNIPTKDGKKMQIGNNPELKPGPADTFMSYDRMWANVSNTPFRMYKHWVHEGGISTPFIVKWPEKITNKKIVHSACHFIDIMPTCLAAAGIKHPKETNSSLTTPLEGISLLPAFRGDESKIDRVLYWEHEGNRACREDAWKLVSMHPHRWELYNMEDDRTEINNLADKEPERVKTMAQKYFKWADRIGVKSWMSWMSD